MKKQILSQLFFEALKRANCTIGNVYIHLFRLSDEDSLENELLYLYNLSEGKDDFFKEDGIENWFAIFHKSVRQTDYFTDCFKKEKKALLTDIENKEFKFLFNKVKSDNYNKKGKDGKLFNDEYRRYLELHEKRKRELFHKDIGGHLDMILWNTIHLDNKDELFKAFKRTFSEYKIEYLPELQKEITS